MWYTKYMSRRSHWFRGLPCYYCGEPSDTREHVVPKSIQSAKRAKRLAPFKGLVPACNECNSHRMSMEKEQFRKWLKTKHRNKSQKHIVAKFAARNFIFYHEVANERTPQSTSSPNQ